MYMYAIRIYTIYMVVALEMMDKHTKLQPWMSIQFKLTLTQANSRDYLLPNPDAPLTTSASATAGSLSHIAVNKPYLNILDIRLK